MCRFTRAGFKPIGVVKEAVLKVDGWPGAVRSVLTCPRAAYQECASVAPRIEGNVFAEVVHVCTRETPKGAQGSTSFCWMAWASPVDTCRVAERVLHPGLRAGGSLHGIRLQDGSLLGS